ncbi:MAG: IS110 family transposase, partial [Chloroflexi bacterium]|nr:IS110 family transposase [Chloroflexota bacterium]
VYHILSSTTEVWVLNARDVKQRPGRKTDRADAKWIAELLAHGLIEPSFVPPPQIVALRDVLRMRTALVQTRTQVKNRVLAVFEDTNIKLATVVSDPFGVSARAMMDALIQGERDPAVLAQLSLGVMRRKIPQLMVALEGSFTEHHGMLIQLNLELIDKLNDQIAKLDQRCEQLMEPMQEQADQLDSIPGVGPKAAKIIISEIGTDMSRFGSAARLSSWAGLCPGNNESAGKRKSGKTRKGNRYLRRVLTECAWAARKTDSFLGDTFARLQKRIGGKKAAVAVAHKILVIVYHLLNEGAEYDEERYNRPRRKQEELQRNRALSVLKRLGYEVELKLAA